MMVKNRLLDFTRSISAGITLAKVSARRILTNLYIQNREKSGLPLLYEGDFPSIYPQSAGGYLDRLGDMFEVPRLLDEDDEQYRIRILFALRQNVTRDGIDKALKVLFGSVMMTIETEVHESFYEVFDGTSSTFDAPMRSHKGSLLYGVTVVIKPTVSHLSEVRVFDGLSTTTVDLGAGKYFNRINNLHYREILNAFQVNSFKELLRGTAAAGVKINNVILVEPGAGGSKFKQI